MTLPVILLSLHPNKPFQVLFDRKQNTDDRVTRCVFSFAAKPSACELRVAQYEKPLTKGHCPIKKSKDPDQKDPEKIAKKRSERRERSHMLKEKIVKLIEGGLQLSEYQARKVLLSEPQKIVI